MLPKIVPDVTQLLNEWRTGDNDAIDNLIPLVYGELHKMARRYMRDQQPGHTLQATALVNEVYLKLEKQRGKACESAAHFFGLASVAMRHILVNYARARKASKRGGETQHILIEDAPWASDQQADEVIALDDALHTLAKLDPRKHRVVELRFFGGRSVEETASLLEISPETVARDWRLAKTWLLRELQRSSRL
ncbi:MAG: sigma-70 family RNA polymerase sigma factor [Acidobacteriia bacterium]|nr:sigma-70 family RNA polymerase sigma factor [Terriglobia bacterium]